MLSGDGAPAVAGRERAAQGSDGEGAVATLRFATLRSVLLAGLALGAVSLQGAIVRENVRVDGTADAPAPGQALYPGHLRIGGTKHGGGFFGGAVRMPEKGICGHQGNFRAHPGNTAESIASAVRLGVAMVEFDAQRCKSGEFVLMHDGTIDNLTTGKGRISDHTLAELKSYRLKSRGGKYQLCTLDEALDVIPDGGIWINLHCYCGRKNIADLARHIKRRGRIHQTCFCAHPPDIEEIRKAVPEAIGNNIRRPGPRNRDWTDAECQQFVDDSIAHKCQFLQLSRPWAKKYSDACHAAGIRVIHYKSDDPKELPDLKARGIDFVMTNRPGEME